MEDNHKWFWFCIGFITACLFDAMVELIMASLSEDATVVTLPSNSNGAKQGEAETVVREVVESE